MQNPTVWVTTDPPPNVGVPGSAVGSSGIGATLMVGSAADAPRVEPRFEPPGVAPRLPPWPLDERFLEDSESLFLSLLKDS